MLTSETKFTQDEWQLQRRLVYLVFFMVAMSDDEVSTDEVAVFLNLIQNWVLLPDPLLRKLFKDIGETPEGGRTEYVEFMNEVQSNHWLGPETLERSVSLLQGTLSSEEYQRFAGGLLLCGLWILRPELLDQKPPREFTEAEGRTLTSLNHRMGLDPASVRKHLGRYEEIEFLLGFRFA
jgi:hypothetical protein